LNGIPRLGVGRVKVNNPFEAVGTGRLNDLVSDASVLHGTKTPAGGVPAEEHPIFRSL